MQIQAELAAPVPNENSEPGPEPKRASTVAHWTILLLAAAVLLLSFTLSVPGEERVYVPGTRLALPGMCVFRSATGLDCPGCGLTRCFISLAHGDLVRAWQFNPAGLLFFAVVAFQIPFQLTQIFRIHSGRGIIRSRHFNSILLVVAGCLIFQWAVKMCILVFA